MDTGTVGVPLDLIQMILEQDPEGIDFDEAFSQMAASGQTVFMPFGIYEEVPEVKSTGYEALFLPPPSGPDPYVEIRGRIFDAMEAHGIKMIVAAAALYPHGTIPVENDPLFALLDAVGDRDLIAAFYTYDEPVLQNVPHAALQAFYEHVKSVRPDLNVIQVNAGIQAGMDVDAYLDAVTVTAQWADMLGWSIYGTDLPGAGLLSPYSDGAIVDRVTAVGDYARWVEETLPDKLRLGVLQGFGVADLYSDEAAAQFPPEVVAAAQAPSIYIMSEMARAMADVDWLIWFGPSYLEDSDGRAWQDILDVSESIADSIGVLVDGNSAADALSEFARAGARTGIVLDLEDEDEAGNPVYSVNDDRFAVAKHGAVYLKQAGTIDYETEPEVTLVGAARLSDGRIATKTFVLTVRDELELTTGTAASEELVGILGPDVIAGLAGDHVLRGIDNDDGLDRGSGADILPAGSGDDRLTGDSGADLFVFQGDESIEPVSDFSTGLDEIGLVGAGTLELGLSGTSALAALGLTEVLLPGIKLSSIPIEEDLVFLASLG